MGRLEGGLAPLVAESDLGFSRVEAEWEDEFLMADDGWLG